MLRILALTFTIAMMASLSVQSGGFAQNASKVAAGACWQTNYVDSSVAGVVSDGRAVYVSRLGGRIHALSAATGEVVWTAELGGGPVSQPLPTKQGLVVVTSRSANDGTEGSGDLRMLSVLTGVTLWSAELAAVPAAALYSVGDKLIYMTGPGKVECFEAANGKKIWSADLKKEVGTSILLDEDRLLAGTSDGRLVLLSLADGRVLDQMSVGLAPTALANFPDGPVAVGDAAGRIFAVELNDSEVKWNLRNGGRVSAFATSGERAIATSFDNFVYALTSSGNIRWKRRLSGRLTGKPVVGETAVLVAAANEGTVYAIDSKNGKVLDRIKIYEEGSDSKISIGRVSGDRFVIANSDSVRSYGVGTCSVNGKKAAVIPAAFNQNLLAPRA